MSLTKPPGPLSGDSGGRVNYRIEGPPHRLYMHEFTRRVRARLADEVVLDTVRGTLLHETGLNPVLYAPVEDVRSDLLERTNHSTHCPFKGDASYWSIRVGDRVADNAVWAYENPLAEAAWLRGLVALQWEAMDAWYDEDEQVHKHLRDPFHRVDVRASSRHIRVLLDGQLVAESKSPMLLSELGRPDRLYLPPEDVRRELLSLSATEYVCPYKGHGSYWSLRLDARLIEDVAWSFPEPLQDSVRIKDHFCFDHPELTIETETPSNR
ncbi:DUF427 domain-containing protein [Nocardia transvalensis]|uniref:DUF427 domain-containing protein n=1 Tax=Nocardia transvalensis TaxID=37333 RepID=UPI001895A8FC|nr:DUF427 domain-containing protein [Nocardia transvalensis]MBF6328140.1 DUF427 domain-containing protein [Nocardia transvalensis]